MKPKSMVAVGVCFLLAATTACSESKKVDVSTTVGQSLDSAFETLGYPADMPLDRFVPLLTPLDVPGKTGPTNVRADPATLVVLAACIIDSSEEYITSPANPDGPSAIALGVAPVEFVTPDVREQTARGEYLDELRGSHNCREDGSTTATYR